MNHQHPVQGLFKTCCLSLPAPVSITGGLVLCCSCRSLSLLGVDERFSYAVSQGGLGDLPDPAGASQEMDPRDLATSTERSLGGALLILFHMYKNSLFLQYWDGTQDLTHAGKGRYH
jgi:hypothetical protein